MGKENLDHNAAIQDPGELVPDTGGVTGLADTGGQREKLPSRKAARVGLATLAIAGIAGCAKVARDKFPTPTFVAQHVVYEEPTPSERPTVVETVFGPGKELMYAMGGLAGMGMGGSERLNGIIKVHENDIRWIMARVDAEAFKSAEVAEVSPRLWTPFLNPEEEMMIGMGEKGAVGIVIPKDGEGKATRAYTVEKVGDITPLTSGKMEYLCFPGSSFEPIMENGNQVQEGQMRLKREKEVLDIYEIDTVLDTTGAVLGIRTTRRLPNGEFAKDSEGKYVFEGEKEKAIVVVTSSADGMTQNVVVMKGELYPVEGKLKEGIIAQFDYSLMLCTFSQKNAQGGVEKLPLTYDPFTGKWEGGNKGEVITVAPEIEGILDLEGFKRVWNESKNRYDYVDVDGKVIAHWDEKANGGKGIVELEASVKSLDFEKHRGLFVDWSAQEAEKEFIRIWEAAGEYKIPLLFNAMAGEIREDKSLTELIGSTNLPAGILLYAPYNCTIEKQESVTYATGEKKYVFALTNQASGCRIRIYVKEENQFIHGDFSAEAGEAVLVTGDKPMSIITLSGTKYTIVIFLGKQIGDDYEPIGFNFDRILTDSVGRLVRIGPAVGK